MTVALLVGALLAGSLLLPSPVGAQPTTKKLPRVAFSASSF
jgi:hypothetical protein